MADRKNVFWALTAFGAVLLAFTLTFHHTLPTWLLAFLVLGASAVGAALLPWFVVTQIQRREEAILRLQETWQALYRASLKIQESLSLKDRLDRLLQAARDVFHLDRLNILLADSEGRWLQAVASLGTEEPLEAIRVPIGPEGGGIAQAYLTQQMIIWEGRGPVPEALRLKPPYDRIKAFRSRVFAIIPLVVQGKAIGVLGADRKVSRKPFDPDTLELLRLFAIQASLSIAYAKLCETLDKRVEERTQALELALVQLRAAWEQAEEASRHKSAFLASMSHELRTPLNSIIGFAEVLQDQTFGPLNEKQARYVHNILVSGRHLLTLINDLLDLSKVEAGKIELHPEAFELREALAAILFTIRPQADVKNLQLQLHVDEALSTITADPTRFKQILYNLLSNAVKFTPEGGRITVTARRVPSSKFQVQNLGPGTMDLIEIAVQDTGIGIRPEDQGRLFQEFVRLDSPLAKGHEGTGLGLVLTKRLVELHSGRIWVESEGEGKGSRFAFLLPLRVPGKRRILVAEDDEAVQSAIQESLQRSGFEVELAPDGEEALAQVEKQMPDLLILDIGLPKLDGLSVLKRLKDQEKARGLPILVLSATDIGQAEEALSLGADEFLTKPFSPSVLLDTVRRLLAKQGKGFGARRRQ